MIGFRSLDIYHLEPTTIADASRLHVALFPRSPLSQLGEGFLRRFYYRVLPSTGAITARIAYVDGQAAGLVVTTPNLAAARRATRKHASLFFGVLALSVLAAPARLVAVFRLMRLSGDEGEAEILSFGVLPGYRSGLTPVPEALYSAGIAQLLAAGARRGVCVVDRDNLEARLFYASRAWVIDGEGDPGWPVPTVRLSKILMP